MDSSAQAEPGYFSWEAPGGKVMVRMQLDVIDRLGAEVMRGFGAIPKRGAEVGGLLLGTVETGVRTTIRIDDFESVACDYKRGPSYLLTEVDGASFSEAYARWQHGGGKDMYAVGYFRSHTRDGMKLGAEDLDLLDRYFPEPEHVALIVKPYATKVSTAGFFVREGEAYPEEAPFEFPFRRRELTGEDPPPRRSLEERRARDPHPDARSDSQYFEEARMAAVPGGAKSKLRAGWLWLPLSFIFLLLGVLLGFQSALTMAPRTRASTVEDLELALNIIKTGDNLTVKWNPNAPAIRAATSGVLEIEDGGFAKPVQLDAANLKGGSIIYRNSSNRVRFRLVVNLNPRLSVAETLEWRQ